MSEGKTLYARLGGYDAIAAVAENLVSRLRADERLGASGHTGAKMGFGARHSYSSIFCVIAPVDRCFIRAGT